MHPRSTTLEKSDMRSRTGFCIAIAVVALAGCATHTQRPTPEIVRAQTLIDQAEKAGAQRYAAASLEQARTKLQEANTADHKGKYDVARARATEAGADAELAAALASSGDAQRSAEEVAKSTETLREEAHRDSNESSPN
jgi:hypothetical protein